MFGSLFLFELPPKWVTVVPALFVVAEFLVFAIFSASFFAVESGAHVHWKDDQILVRWLLINGLYHILISVFCSKATRYVERGMDQLGSTPFAKVLYTYRGYLDAERVGSRWLGIFSLIAVVVSQMSSERSCRFPPLANGYGTFFPTSTPVPPSP